MAAKKANKKATSDTKKETKKDMKKEIKKEAKKENPKLEKKAAKKEVTKEVGTEPVKVKAEKVAKPKKPKLTPEEKKANSEAKKAEKVAAQAAATNLEENKLWQEYKEKYGAQKANTYTMKGVFPAQQPLQHKVLGWGFILNNTNDRLEVLFESGKKILISNYQN